MQYRKRIRSAFALSFILGCSGNAATEVPEIGRAERSAPVSASTYGKQSLVWVWHDYANSLAAVLAHPSSFTHVSPAFYQMNYAYASGVPAYWNQTSDSFDGLSSSEICQKVHAAGMKCVPLIFAGGGNAGTDLGIHDVLDDSPAGARDSLVGSLVSEAIAKGYDGYNLDWEFDPNQTTRATYGAKLDAFLGTLKTALNAHGMELSFDLGTWFIQQTSCSSGAGVVDLETFGDRVDTAIVEAYTNILGTPRSSCPSALPSPATCGDFTSVLDLMCVYLPMDKISIGLDARPDTFLANSPIAGDALAETKAYGIRNVAVWPDSNSDGPNGSYAFMNDKAIQPPTATWYGLLSAFLE